MAKKKDTPAVETPAAPAPRQRQPLVIAGRGREKTNPGKLQVNMGPMSIVPGSLKELKGKYGDGLSFAVKVPTRTSPIYVPTYDEKLVERVKQYAENGKPMNNLLNVARGTNHQTGLPSIYYNLSDLDARRPVNGWRLHFGEKEVPTGEGNETRIVPKTEAFIEGAIGAKQISEVKDNDGNAYVRGVIMAAGHPVKFIVAKEDAEGTEIMDVLNRALNEGKGSLVRVKADVYVDYNPDYGSTMEISQLQAFYAPFADKPVDRQDESDQFHDTESPVPMGAPGM